MANRGRHEFSVQEAVNMASFVSWNYQEMDIDGDNDAHACTFITSTDPAKKVVIYDKPGSAAGVMDATDILTLVINGAAAPGIVKIDATDLPFTLSGLMITSLTIANSAGDNANSVSVLSFH